MKLAEVAAVLADNSRATMCLALIDGRAWTVSGACVANHQGWATRERLPGACEGEL